MIQIVVYLKEGPSRAVKDALAGDLTEVVRHLLPEAEPVEVWFREYGPGRVYLGGKEV